MNQDTIETINQKIEGVKQAIREEKEAAIDYSNLLYFHKSKRDLEEYIKQREEESKEYIKSLETVLYIEERKLIKIQEEL